MNTGDRTPISLLDRLTQRAEESDWERFVGVYQSLIERWLSRAGVEGGDRDDLTQEILTVLVRALPGFEHNGHAGAFRKWLRTIVLHRVLQFCRQRDQQPRSLQALGCQHESEALLMEDRVLTASWEREHDEHVLRQLLKLVQRDFTLSTWTAFQRHVLDGNSVEEVARQLSLTPNAVMIAKSRVLKRLRREAAGLID